MTRRRATVELPEIPGGGTAEDTDEGMPDESPEESPMKAFTGGVTDEGMPGGGCDGGDGALVLGNFFATASGTSSPPEHANAQCEQRLRTSASPNAKC